MAQRRLELAQKMALLVDLLMCWLVVGLQPAVGSPRLPYPLVPRAEGLAPIGMVEYPFGQLSVASDGTLYYVDRADGQIDEITAGGPRTFLSSLSGRAVPSGSIAGLSGLSVTNNAMWFTAGDGLYQASLGGRAVRRDGSVPGAVDLDVLGDGTTFFTTATAIFEGALGG